MMLMMKRMMTEVRVLEIAEERKTKRKKIDLHSHQCWKLKRKDRAGLERVNFF